MAKEPTAKKDPNIGNEEGHTIYPKWVDHPTETEKRKDGSVAKDAAGKPKPARVLVQDADEEEAVTGKKPKKAEGW